MARRPRKPPFPCEDLRVVGVSSPSESSMPGWATLVAAQSLPLWGASFRSVPRWVVETLPHGPSWCDTSNRSLFQTCRCSVKLTYCHDDSAFPRDDS